MRIGSALDHAGNPFTNGSEKWHEKKKTETVRAVRRFPPLISALLCSACKIDEVKEEPEIKPDPGGERELAEVRVRPNPLGDHSSKPFHVSPVVILPVEVCIRLYSTARCVPGTLPPLKTLFLFQPCSLLQWFSNSVLGDPCVCWFLFQPQLQSQNFNKQLIWLN